MKRRNVMLLLFLVALGITLANSNYQFQFSLVEQGQWVTIDEYRADDPSTYDFFEPEQTIEGGLVKQFGTSAVGDDYVDSTQSTTYGTVTDGPPSGMGSDSEGGGAWLAGWNYRKNHTISGSSG